MKYEIIVVGGGHAGCEAALATARKGHNTLLVTGNIKNIKVICLVIHQLEVQQKV